MKLFIKTIIISTLVIQNLHAYQYQATGSMPYGAPNPSAPKQIKDFKKLIGLHLCKSVKRNQDKSWADAVNMQWTFKYIMNGKAIQDMTLKEDGNHSGSIRTFDSENKTWQVSYYSSINNPNLENIPMWKGGKKDKNLVFYKDQTTPDGIKGYYRLTFHEISNSGFKWVGAWVNTEETIEYPTWKISCKKT